jgi:HK97 family phage portal protein
MRSLIANTLRSVLKAVEGQPRPGPYYLPITGGWLPDGAPANWWQLGYNPIYTGTCSAMVEACVSAYAQTIAMLPGDHWRLNSKNGRDRVRNSALSRILRSPNAYQSISDFMLNMVRALYMTGNAYALGIRNDRYEIGELHMMHPEMSHPRLAQNGEIFYWLGGNDIVAKSLNEEFLVVPARDVLHVRLHVRKQYPMPLIGESPITAAYSDIGVGEAIAQQQVAFYKNEARPSAILSTDLVLDKDQTQALRDRWNEQVKGLNQGGTPILTAGLKVQPWAFGGKDANTAEILKLSNEHIALAFRVPLQILGLGGTPYSSTELLMQSWIASGLGFALNHFEEALGLMFMLKGVPDEYVEFDTHALLRSAHKDRIEALARGVQTGIYSPNEARNMENLSNVKDGEEPRVQQQIVPLSQIEATPPAPAPNAPPPAPASPVSPTKDDINEVIRREVQHIHASAKWKRSQRGGGGLA